MFIIYSIIPCLEGDHKRVVEEFSTKEDAQKVIRVLEEVNVDFNYYVIEER